MVPTEVTVAANIYLFKVSNRETLEKRVKYV